MSGTVQRMSFADFLAMQGYENIKPLPERPGFYGATRKFLFTTGICLIRDKDTVGLDDRWCYHDAAAARAALVAWDGRGEPQGWHRQLAGGRRRPDGDPSREYVEW